MLNKVQIMGRLTRDPETRTFQNGGMVTSVGLATNERWKDRNSGEQRERSEFHAVSIYAEATARYISNYAKKGDLVYIEGKLETRKWQDQSGNDRYTTEIVIRPYNGQAQIIPTGRRNGAANDMANGSANGAGDQARGPAAGSGETPGDSNASWGSDTTLDGEIPF